METNTSAIQTIDSESIKKDNLYYIPEDNMERLEKRLETLRKKCEKAGAEFHYEKVGEEMREIKKDDKVVGYARYIVVKVDGTLRHDDWRFVATLQHEASGNIVRQFDRQLMLPAKYMTCGPACEHCNRIRSRKDTYVVYNETTGEFKQVARNCLAEYTRGLSAEDVAWFASIYDALDNAGAAPSSGYTSYTDRDEVLRYAAECVLKWGYKKVPDYEYDFVPADYRSTKTDVIDFMRLDRGRCSGKEREFLQDRKDEVGFDADSDEARDLAQKALEWISAKEDEPGYIHNIKVASSEQWLEGRSIGLVVSVIAAYNRDMKKKEDDAKKAEENAQRAEADQKSEYVGNIGERISVEIASAEFIREFYNEYGCSYLYKFRTPEGNVLTWFTSTYINLDEVDVKTLKGTVKQHTEYNTVKETALTRCKVNA